jgi:HAD superfamily hydrolase (TIGR01509 family)
MASIMERFLAHLPPDGRVAVMEEKEATFRTLARQGLTPAPGLMAVLDAADAAGLPMVAVTNAPRLNAELMLDGLRIGNRFKAIIIGDELARGKPDPLPYRGGLRRAGAEAGLSVAFEDSRAGIQSATAAGLATVGMRTSLTDEQLKSAGAVMSADDFTHQGLIDFVKHTVAGGDLVHS